MIKKIFLISVLALAIAAPSFVIAGHYHGGHGFNIKSWNMDDLDTDNNGVVDFEEFVAPSMEKWKSGFNRVDTNGDGDIDGMEWMELRELHGVKTQ